MSKRTPSFPIAHLQRPALWLAAGGLLLALVGFVLARADFWHAWLFALLFWLEIALGCLGLVLLHHVAGGRWSAAVRPIAEAAAMTLPLLALFFVPLLLVLPSLYPWADGAQMAASPLLQQKSAWLNVPFFVGRTLLYFAVWSFLAARLRRLSQAEAAGTSSDATARLRRLAPVGMILYFVTTTFAAFDWMMSLEPAWFSSIYGLHFLAGQAVAGVSLAILGLAATSRPAASGTGAETGQAGDVLQSFNDLGNLLLASVMIWAYFAFSQYLIIWSANIPEESVWYFHRSQGGWQWLAGWMIGLHFVLPFLLLLSRSFKRSPYWLAWLAGLLFGVRALDLFWLIIPAFHPAGLYFHWLYPVLLVGMGGGWLWFFVRQWSNIPVHQKQGLPAHVSTK